MSTFTELAKAGRKRALDRRNKTAQSPLILTTRVAEIEEDVLPKDRLSFGSFALVRPSYNIWAPGT